MNVIAGIYHRRTMRMACWPVGDCCAAATARALLGVDQRQLAPLSGIPVTIIQRSEASAGVIRGKVIR
jgi:hypothetical protein